MSYALKASTALINLPFPYGIRKGLFRMIRPNDYTYFQWLKLNTEEGSEHSLEGYIKNKCIFVHIPKCAGISVCKSLFGNHGGSHMGIRQYQLVFSKKEFNEYFKFAFVRNPWDRLYSAYQYLSTGGRSSHDRDWFLRNLAQFKDFKTFIVGWVNSKNIYTYPHFVPQYRFVEDCHKRIRLDFIGKFEHLERDFSHVCHRLNIEGKLQVRNSNANRFESYRDAYDEDCIEIVRNIYEKDIEIFEYSYLPN